MKFWNFVSLFMVQSFNARSISDSQTGIHHDAKEIYLFYYILSCFRVQALSFSVSIFLLSFMREGISCIMFVFGMGFLFIFEWRPVGKVLVISKLPRWCFSKSPSHCYRRRGCMLTQITVLIGEVQKHMWGSMYNISSTYEFKPWTSMALTPQRPHFTEDFPNLLSIFVH